MIFMQWSGLPESIITRDNGAVIIALDNRLHGFWEIYILYSRTDKQFHILLSVAPTEVGLEDLLTCFHFQSRKAAVLYLCRS